MLYVTFQTLKWNLVASCTSAIFAAARAQESFIVVTLPASDTLTYIPYVAAVAASLEAHRASCWLRKRVEIINLRTVLYIL